MPFTRDISAVVTIHRKDLLFSVNNDFSLSYYESRTPDESEDKQYMANTIVVGGNIVYVNKELPLVSAVAYQDPYSKKEEVRVYYFSSSLGLCELVRTDRSDDWSNGKLNNKFTAKPTSQLSANVVALGREEVGQLKVYFSNADQTGGEITCAYANLGKGNWSAHNKITGS